MRAHPRWAETRSGIVHHFHAHGDVADAYAEIDQRLPFPRGIPFGNIIGSGLEFQRSRHAVMGLKLIVARLLPVLVEIDESRRDDQSLGIDGRTPRQRRFGYGGDLASADADVAHSIQARLRIHHPAIGDHQIVGLVCRHRILCRRARANANSRKQHSALPLR